MQLQEQATVKVLNFQTPTMFAVITLKFKQRDLPKFRNLSKSADRMANSVDPDQTAPLGLLSSRSSLIWVYTVCQGLSVQKHRIVTVA